MFGRPRPTFEFRLPAMFFGPTERLGFGEAYLAALPDALEDAHRPPPALRRLLDRAMPLVYAAERYVARDQPSLPAWAARHCAC